jgi:transcriptional regulator GlxA family with amidase domain
MERRRVLRTASLNAVQREVPLKSLREIEMALFGEELACLRQRLSYDSRLETMWNYIEENYADWELHHAAVAKAAGLGEKNLSRLLRFYLQMPLHELLTKYRVYRAAAILLVKNESVLRVAESVGLSQSSLERASTKYLRMTPVELRNRCRETFRREPAQARLTSL